MNSTEGHNGPASTSNLTKPLSKFLHLAFFIPSDLAEKSKKEGEEKASEGAKKEGEEAEPGDKAKELGKEVEAGKEVEVETDDMVELEEDVTVNVADNSGKKSSNVNLCEHPSTTCSLAGGFSPPAQPGVLIYRPYGSCLTPNRLPPPP